MDVFFAVLGAVLLVLLIFSYLWSRRLEKGIAERDAQILATDRESERLRKHYESEALRVGNEARAAILNSQQLVDKQLLEINLESERVRKHYEYEVLRINNEAKAAISKANRELEPLRKYEGFRDAEEEVKRLLDDAIKEATSLRADAQTLMEQTRVAAAKERSAAVEKVKDIHEQADARLNQALSDAGRIVAEAEKRAEQIAGEAYTALRDKQLLEQAAEAMRNTIEGYGDRYLVPTHSLLDDLAVEYGYDAAGQSLASAREQSRRMVEQGQASDCDYVEASRRNTAIQFVIHAFNGSVDATLSRVKSDNYGTLEQRIRDCYAIVNGEGSAFRNARILPAYLDARLAELKWAVILQALALKDREEQRFLKERARDEELARRENEKRIREAEEEEQLKIQAKEEAKRAFEEEAAKLKEQHKQELDEARKIGSSAVEEAEKRHADEIAEMNEKHTQQLAEKDQQLKEATEHKLTIAERTKEGRIYVISNVGSFGEGVYKIGFTRREAKERVDELNSASVPFEFDIHAEIVTKHAPDLEYELHQQFLEMRVNKANPRKEFFRVTFNDIRRVVDNLEQGKDSTGKVVWTEKAKAEQWHETLDIEGDAQEKDKWLRKERLLADRRKRATSRLSPSVGLEAVPNGEHT